MIYLNDLGVKGDWGRAFKYVAIATAGLFGIIKCGDVNSYIAKRSDQSKQYVMDADSARYNRIENSSEYQEMSAQEKTFFWPREAKRVEDSIKIYGNAQESYVKATQMNN